MMHLFHVLACIHDTMRSAAVLRGECAVRRVCNVASAGARCSRFAYCITAPQAMRFTLWGLSVLQHSVGACQYLYPCPFC
jgi:hypothetical protein